MKTILCYGDSNTFGWDADNNRRLPYGQRWPEKLKINLGEDYNVIVEGLPGRTTVFYDPVMDLISGADYIYPCLYSHQPIDMVIIMLGTNDLKSMFSCSALDSSWGLERVINIIQGFQSDLSNIKPKTFIISPALIIEPKLHFVEMFRGAEEKATMLAPYYKEVAAKTNSLFLDASKYIEPSKADGIHINENGHRILGHKIAGVIKDYYMNKYIISLHHE